MQAWHLLMIPYKDQIRALGAYNFYYLKMFAFV